MSRQTAARRYGLTLERTTQEVPMWQAWSPRPPAGIPVPGVSRYRIGAVWHEGRARWGAASSVTVPAVMAFFPSHDAAVAWVAEQARLEPLEAAEGGA